MAEILVCPSLGIVEDGEDITTVVLDAFADRFKENLSSEVLTGMRAYLRLMTPMHMMWRRPSWHMEEERAGPGKGRR